MKVGIMSMQRVINYGSYMQAFALKTMLEGLGHEVVFVDYKAKPSIHHRRSAAYWLQKGKEAVKNTGLVWSLANLYRGRPVSYRVPKLFTDGERAFIPALEELGVDYENFHYHTQVDTLIIGSDEVFNCLQNADNVGYSLELFGKNNRAKKLISYAASFGNTTLERLNEYGVSKQIGRYLDRFDTLSVRDENSAQIVRSLTGKEPCQHLDPALIGGIEKMRWETNDEKGYVAVYAYPKRITADEGNAITTFASAKGLRVLSLCGTQHLAGFEDIRPCTPYEILPYIRNADYVVTDTFHGTIFSVINHIPFAVFCRRPQDVSYSNSEKLLDLLGKLHLMDRLVSDGNGLDEVFSRAIDFEAVDAIRERERTAALEYLRSALDG